MEPRRLSLKVLLPLVPIALIYAYHYLAIDACLDMGGSASSTFRTCVLTERRIFVSSYELLSPALTALMFLAGLGAIIYWITLFKQINYVVRALLGIQIVTIAIVTTSIFVGKVHHTSWQPLTLYAGILAGILAGIASIVGCRRAESWRWLLTIPAALVLTALGFILIVACCFRMGS